MKGPLIIDLKTSKVLIAKIRFDNVTNFKERKRSLVLIYDGIRTVKLEVNSKPYTFEVTNNDSFDKILNIVRSNNDFKERVVSSLDNGEEGDEEFGLTREESEDILSGVIERHNEASEDTYNLGGSDDAQLFNKFINGIREVEELKRLARKEPMVDTTPKDVTNIGTLSQTENEGLASILKTSDSKELQDNITSLREHVNELEKEIGYMDKELATNSDITKDIRRDQAELLNTISQLKAERAIKDDTLTLLDQKISKLRQYDNTTKIEDDLARLSEIVNKLRDHVGESLDSTDEQLNDIRDEFGKICLDISHFQDELSKRHDIVNEDIHRVSTRAKEERDLLERRLDGVGQAIKRLEEQEERVSVREQQEEDISRLQKFKKWAKENIAGVSALAISIAGII